MGPPVCPILNMGSFCKTSGEKWALFGKNMGKVYVILLSFCDLVHVQSVVDLFAEKLSNK